MQALLDERSLSRLRWRCRRGLLENDLFIERFFADRGARITSAQATGLETLMDLPDNDLLDLLLRRREPEGALASADVIEVLGLMRRPVASEDPAQRAVSSPYGGDKNGTPPTSPYKERP